MNNNYQLDKRYKQYKFLRSHKRICHITNLTKLQKIFRIKKREKQNNDRCYRIRCGEMEAKRRRRRARMGTL